MKNLKTAFVNGIIISDGKFINGSTLLINGDKIEKIVDSSIELNGIHIIDVEGAYVCPGFIDLQIMGAGGALFGGNPSVEALSIMENQLIREGVIGFLPTVSTNEDHVIDKAILSAIEFRQSSIGNFMGLHLEGPYINPSNRGAHPAKFIRPAEITEIKRLVKKSVGEIKMLTLAPEMQDSIVLEYLEKQDFVTALGHTGANYNQARDFLIGERKAVTHLFNGMPPMHHRNPGPIPAIFENKPYTSIVADGIHVDYNMVAIAKIMLGEFLYLISDAATPYDKGVYQHIYNGNHYVTLDNSGSKVLSGSKLTMLSAVKNCVESVGISLPESINMASLYPARLMGIDSQFGSIKSGYSASLVVFNRDFEIKKVFFKGKSI